MTSWRLESAHHLRRWHTDEIELAMDFGGRRAAGGGLDPPPTLTRSALSSFAFA